MLALLLSMLILPADTVTGHVVDKAGQPIPQASVEVTDLGTIVTTAADGGFRIVLAPGRYTLTVRRTGFAPAVCEISVGTGQPALAIVLAPSAFRLEPVTVTATRQPLASQLSPLSAASNNIELAPGAQVEGARGNMGWRVAAIGRHASNLHTPAGELDNTGFGAFNGEAAAGWRWPSGSSLSARVVHYGGEFKLLEANAPPGETGGPPRKAGGGRGQITRPRPGGQLRAANQGPGPRPPLIDKTV